VVRDERAGDVTRINREGELIMSGYNGYTNYETWLVCAFLDNEEAAYVEAQAIVADLADPDDNDNDGIETGQTAKALKEWITNDLLPELDGLASDFINAALSEVNWQEVATTREPE
jgi:hypothetical protein